MFNETTGRVTWALGTRLRRGGLLRLVNIKMVALEPYRFEPECVRDIADDESSEDNELNERFESTFWCSCRKCVVNVNAERVYLFC